MEEKLITKRDAQSEGKTSSVVAAIVAAVIVIGGIVFFLGGRSKDTSPPSVPASSPSTPVQNAPASPMNSVGQNQNAKTFDISSKPFEFSVKEIRVKKGDTVRINLTNTQGLHDWVIDEFSARTKQINAGQSDSIEFVADKTGTFEYYCSVGNHRQMGMVGKLIVE